MYGITIGTLNIYFKYETNSTWLLMFSKNGNQGNQWLQGIFNLPKSNVTFQVRVRIFVWYVIFKVIKLTLLYTLKILRRLL